MATMNTGRGPRSIFGGALSPVIVVAWLWSGLVILLLLYLQTVLSQPSPDEAVRISALRELWLGPTPLGLPLRHVVKVVNVLFIVFLWLRFRSSSRRRERTGLFDRLLYLGTAALLLAVEWACHVLGQSMARS